MRRIALMLTLLAALPLAACNNSSSSGQQQAAKTAAVANSVSGKISLMKPRQLSSKATMTIQLVDASTDGAAPLASKTIAPVPSMPMDYSLDFKRADINPSDIYLVKVDLTDGVRTFSMPVQAPVITRDAPTTQNIVLVANKTPAEILEGQYAKLQQNLGAYQISNGRELEKDESRGWQTFRSNDDGKIVFVRENVDHGKKGFSNLEFAYHDGKAWYVVVRTKASQDAKTSDVMRAGWNDAGKLVVSENTSGGKTAPLSDADVSKLQSQASAMLKLARAKTPARRKR